MVDLHISTVKINGRKQRVALITKANDKSVIGKVLSVVPMDHFINGLAREFGFTDPIKRLVTRLMVQEAAHVAVAPNVMTSDLL